ncbi:hypothetical protein RHGRI_019042 [Rhododendron griersonianum]|uniref:Transmembrane protein n=1 Tax=Rhododendron griersonianum TaxID=479676 RepID=A0AAV6JAW4_9ERIC|nr:hypothetical protein RHGRI_019042 [Rhododendron griersonianum]
MDRRGVWWSGKRRASAVWPGSFPAGFQLGLYWSSFSRSSGCWWWVNNFRFSIGWVAWPESSLRLVFVAWLGCAGSLVARLGCSWRFRCSSRFHMCFLGFELGSVRISLLSGLRLVPNLGVSSVLLLQGVPVSKSWSMKSVLPSGFNMK